MSGKDGDDIIRISMYLIEYQKIKYHSKINLSGKSGTFVKYQDISFHVTSVIYIQIITHIIQPIFR